MRAYKIEEVHGMYTAEDIMNRMARDGWHVISVNFDPSDDCYTITFEKYA